jgi:hypothetical protein
MFQRLNCVLRTRLLSSKRVRVPKLLPIFAPTMAFAA